MTDENGRAFATEWLGTVAYDEALAGQLAAVAARREGTCGDRLLLLEHPPVITLGRSTKPENLLTPSEELSARGIDVREVARGGDVTFHGPGQLVGYPIFDLKARGTPDVFAFLRNLEAALIEALEELGLRGAAVPGMTGVYVADSEPKRKIASIGIGVKRWVTFHGFALNLTLDPAAFGDIVPCGLHDVEMTSVAHELGRPGCPELFDAGRRAVERAFERVFTSSEP